MIPSLSSNNRHRRGIALIVVVSILGLLLVFVLALFTLSENELKGASRYSNGQQARNLADVALSVVTSQLRKGSGQDPTATTKKIWTSQPGLVRKYALSGELENAYKLYSSSQMILGGGVANEQKIIKDVPPRDWQTKPDRYVDLNRPLLRSDASGNVRELFPIIDPRAYTGGADTVRGFSYSDKFTDGSTIEGVKTTGGDAQRLPMPVEWLYQLKDGSLGTLDSNNIFVGPTAPTESNPITGRIAFWTDDESSKVNINTASEPTPWVLPTFFHKRDSEWARYQPVNGEFQRYPGHPATTALSPILFPDKTTLTKTDKDLIYAITPKIGAGGSRGGTVGYDDPSTAAIDLARSRKEHLYATLDELLLKDDRTNQDFGGVSNIAEVLQRKSFFLTAQSRAPESNPFGLPKIAMWPTSYRGADFRTPFDDVIEFCSTLSQNTSKRRYMFQRGYAHSTTKDITNTDNVALLNYLHDNLKKPIPGFASSSSKNFLTKYGDDLPQILVEFFDYIRSVNLYDGNLVDETTVPPNATSNTLYGYANSGWERPINFKTFTDPRFVMNGLDPETNQMVENEYRGLPGHGQVVPSVWTRAGKSYLGIARFPTVSEVGLHFICNADNTDDPKNPFVIADPVAGKPGGGSAPKIKSTDGNVKDRWYSNFPPNPAPDPTKGQKANLGKYPKTEGFPYGNDVTHPGYNPVNWNWQLKNNEPLPAGKRRVQARMLLEFFIPAAGYTVIEPDFSVKVTGLKNFKVLTSTGLLKPLFPNNIEILRSGRKATHNGATQTGGFSLGLKGLLRERECPPRTPMPADNSYGTVAWQVKPSQSADPPESLSVLNYDLVSDFIDIDVGSDGSTSMQISDADITIEIYGGHLGKSVSLPEIAAQKVQTLVVGFPANTVKAPTLVRNPIDDTLKTPSSTPTEAPYWWSFYGKGCMGFDVTGANALKKGTDAVVAGLGGRFHGSNVAPQVSNEPRPGAFFYGFDSIAPGAPHPFRPVQAKNASTQADIDAAEEAEGSDVVQTMIIKHGDYRLTAAMPLVDKAQWVQHRFWGTKRLAHNFSNQTSNQMPGYDYGGDSDIANRLVGDTGKKTYANNRIPDFPYNTEAATAAHRYYDFDNGFGPDRDGPYINKPDEGSLGVQNSKLAYFEEINKATPAGTTFFTPNRQIPSPVIFGSLPVGVKAQDAWRTLLFRPQEGHPGGQDTPDHLFLEFFWMPVVEPYAISEPFSTAGKINLNYQIVPFTNIRRSSGLHAVMENEVITAVPNEDIADYKAWPNANDTTRFWTDSDSKQWHYKVDIDKTLKQLDDRFAQGKAFLTPSEICDVHLVPQGVSDASQMEDFWRAHRVTGDNTRERPYGTIYPRLTTRSNTYRVHMVTQVIKKARSSAVDTITPADRVTSEYRGSAVIERYLDPTQTTLPDFTSSTNTQTLDDFHQFRVIDSKKFGS